MEEEIEDYLKERYKLDIEVKFKEFRRYLVYVKFEKLTAEINFKYDNHYTFVVNMASLMNYIDKCILEYFKKEGV